MAVMAHALCEGGWKLLLREYEGEVAMPWGVLSQQWTSPVIRARQGAQMVASNADRKKCRYREVQDCHDH